MATLRRLFRLPLDDATRAMEAIVRDRSPVSALTPLVVAIAITWIVYVPVHELLHALGCAATGGDVSELQIQAVYAGALLARVFDFVVVGGEYAGRLSGFDTHGRDLVYLATVLTPYLLSVFPGVTLLHVAARRASPWLFGVAAVLAFAPIYNIPGDYFETASILTTRVATWLGAGSGNPAFAELRSDDVPISDIAVGPDSSVWAVAGREGETDDGRPILRWTGEGWQPTSGMGVRIAVDPV